MSPREKKLREKGAMLERSYAFWNGILNSRMEALESDDDYETPEEYHESLDVEKELKYIMSHIEFEGREMEKYERDIISYLDDDEN